MKTKIHNNTPFSQEEINGFAVLGDTTNNWRQRNIRLYQHPANPDSVISVGTTFDGGMVVIADEPKTAWATALDYAARGKVYVSE